MPKICAETLVNIKVIIEKSRGEVSLVEQDTIENVSQANFFFQIFLRKKKLPSFYADITKFSTFIFLAHET